MSFSASLRLKGCCFIFSEKHSIGLSVSFFLMLSKSVPQSRGPVNLKQEVPGQLKKKRLTIGRLLFFLNIPSYEYPKNGISKMMVPSFSETSTSRSAQYIIFPLCVSRSSISYSKSFVCFIYSNILTLFFYTADIQSDYKVTLHKGIDSKDRRGSDNGNRGAYAQGRYYIRCLGRHSHPLRLAG